MNREDIRQAVNNFKVRYDEFLNDLHKKQEERRQRMQLQASNDKNEADDILGNLDNIA